MWYYSLHLDYPPDPGQFTFIEIIRSPLVPGVAESMYERGGLGDLGTRGKMGFTNPESYLKSLVKNDLRNTLGYLFATCLTHSIVHARTS